MEQRYNDVTQDDISLISVISNVLVLQGIRETGLWLAKRRVWELESGEDDCRDV